jgi:hypothetical protein
MFRPLKKYLSRDTVPLNVVTNKVKKNDPTLAKKTKDDNFQIGYKTYMYNTDSTELCMYFRTADRRLDGLWKSQ